MKEHNTDGKNQDFIALCALLDQELYRVVGEEEQKNNYDQYNTLDHIHDAVLLYEGKEALACASFKEYAPKIAELKRVYVKDNYRKGGLGRQVVKAIEQKAKEKGYTHMILETGKQLPSALYLYEKLGYQIIKNYGQYQAMPDSICMAKVL